MDWRTEVDYTADNCGVVLAASGAPYVALARQLAQSIRDTNPGLPVDLFTDQEGAEGPFDQVHILSQSSYRPKFEACLRSRFDRTLMLDVDIVVTCDISDMFWVLSKYDLAAAHVQNRNQPFANRFRARSFPNAFPQINGGALAFRKNAKTTQFFEKWQKLVFETYGGGADQPPLRELIWSEDLNFHIFPEEYNFRKVERLYTSNWTVPAPRILHSSKFVRAAKAGRAITPAKVLGRLYMRLLRLQLLGDLQVTSEETRKKSLIARIAQRPRKPRAK